MPRVRLARVEAYEFDDFRFPSPFHEQQQWPQFLNRGIVTSQSVDLEPSNHKYLNDMLIRYGWGGLMDLPEVVYPNLVRMFYTNVEIKGRGARTILKFYLKGKWYTLNRSMFTSIFDIELDSQFAYFVTDPELKELAYSMGPINSISVTSSKISEKVTTKACNRGNPRVDDEVAPQAPAASVAPAPALAPVPAQFAQFLQTVTRSLKDLQRRYTELRADTLHGSSPLARLKAT
ncbi:hypothetical protein Dimus_031956 [Dionaea muscipula]